MGKRPKLEERLRWIEKRWHDLNLESFPLVTLEWNQPDLHLFMLFFKICPARILFDLGFVFIPLVEHKLNLQVQIVRE